MSPDASAALSLRVGKRAVRQRTVDDHQAVSTRSLLFIGEAHIPCSARRGDQDAIETRVRPERSYILPHLAHELQPR